MKKPSQRVRLTISVTPEVHAGFQRLADSAGMSLSKTMGEWLGDTLEAVEFAAAKMEEARSAPKRVMRQLHSYALGLSEETATMLEAAGASKRRVAPALPPSSNTGGKSPGKARRSP